MGHGYLARGIHWWSEGAEGGKRAAGHHGFSGGQGGAFIGLEWKPVCPSFLSLLSLFVSFL